MTTIATDGVSMSGDGMVSYGVTLPSISERKIFKHKGDVYGRSGSLRYTIPMIKKWIDKGMVNEDLPDQVTIIRLAEGCVEVYDSSMQSIHRLTNGECVAIGSGTDYALAAMEGGASPKNAIDIASRFDKYTGGKIVTIKL